MKKTKALHVFHSNRDWHAIDWFHWTRWLADGKLYLIPSFSREAPFQKVINCRLRVIENDKRTSLIAVSESDFLSVYSLWYATNTWLCLYILCFLANFVFYISFNTQCHISLLHLSYLMRSVIKRFMNAKLNVK